MQGVLFYSVGPHTRETAFAEMEVEITREKFLEMSKHTSLSLSLSLYIYIYIYIYIYYFSAYIYYFLVPCDKFGSPSGVCSNAEVLM